MCDDWPEKERALALGFGAGMSAAGKSSQFTGVVKAVDGGTLTPDTEDAGD